MERYDILRKLGGGGTSDVFLAYDMEAKDAVVVKKAYKTTLPSVYQEIEVMKKLNGIKGIPSLIEAREDSIFFYLVMEYVRGRELIDVIDDDVNVSHIFFELCRIMKEAHERNIIHRDVKAENIIVTPSQAVYIIDWGLALDLGEPSSKHATPAGTTGYISPEVFQLRHLGAEPDIWCLGYILHSLLTKGTVPYKQGKKDVFYRRSPMIILSSELSRDLQDFLQRFFVHFKLRISLRELIERQDEYTKLINSHNSTRFLTQRRKTIVKSKTC